MTRVRKLVDPTIFTVGLTTGITGLHCDITILDDVVVKENALSREQQIELMKNVKDRHDSLFRRVLNDPLVREVARSVREGGRGSDG